MILAAEASSHPRVSIVSALPQKVHYQSIGCPQNFMDSTSPEIWFAISCPNVVSAGAKIPIVPVEFSPPLDVVNRSPLHTEEAPKLVKGERRARTKRTATARNEHPGHQQVDWLGPQDDSQVHA